MRVGVFFLVFIYSNVTMADLQSEFHSRFGSVSPNKVASPEKMKAALKIIEKKIGSAVQESQSLQSDPYQADIDSQKYRFFIDQLIFVKLKNDTLCRGRLETFGSQATFRALKVICIDKKDKLQYFDGTL